MAIYFHVDKVKFSLKKKEIKKWLKEIIKSEGYQPENINYIFTSDTCLLEINNKYLKSNYFTDVISFDYSNEEKISGDIYISIDTVKKNACKYSNNFSEELKRVMVHGLLHLMGYEDKSVKGKRMMNGKEKKYLEIDFEKK